MSLNAVSSKAESLKAMSLKAMSLSAISWAIFSSLSWPAALENTKIKLDKEKYSNFSFNPQYSSQNKNYSLHPGAQALESFLKNEYLKSWHALSIMSVLDFDKYTAFYINVTLTNGRKYINYKDEQAKKGMKVGPGEWQAVVLQEKDNQNFQLIKKAQKLLPVGRGAGDYYGCLENAPLFKIHVAGREMPELFIVTGGGEQTSSINGGGTFDSLNLTLFSLEQEAIVTDFDMMAVNYKSASIIKPGAFAAVESNYRNLAKISSEKGEGRKKFTKLFFSDFDKDGLMNIVKWTREYEGRIFQDPTDKNKEPFELSDSKFVVYTEALSNKVFEISTVPVTTIEQWLSDNKLGWTDGWPNKTKGNHCTGARKDLPMNWIKDPILQK